MALRGEGEFTTLPVTSHFESHCAVINRFLGRQPTLANQGTCVYVRFQNSGQT
jgi:RNA 3'-terminal phosphate cyclase